MANAQKIMSSAVIFLLVLIVSCQSAPSNSTRKGVPVQEKVSTPAPTKVNSTAVHRTGRAANNRTVSGVHSAEDASDEEDDKSVAGGAVKNPHFQIFHRPQVLRPASSIQSQDDDSSDFSPVVARNNTAHVAANATNHRNPASIHTLFGSGAVVN